MYIYILLCIIYIYIYIYIYTCIYIVYIAMSREKTFRDKKVKKEQQHKWSKK